MLEKIPKFPDVPDSLRVAASQKNLVPFIGAGVSKLAGYPDWDELATAALNFFVKKGKISFAQLDQVSKLPSRVKLSLAVELEKQHALPINFKGILKPTKDKEELGNEVYEQITKLWRYAKTFVTTNYDEELGAISPVSLRFDEQDESDTPSIDPPTLIYKFDELNASSLDRPNAVLQLHGSVKNRDSMVLTSADYLERYYGHVLEGQEYRENFYLTLLKDFFISRNVLFIGYGLNELEVLEYVIQKGIEKRVPNTTIAQEAPRHYVVQGFFTHELELARSLESYFLSFGIELLPYSRDDNDWENLIDVIRHLNDELPPGTRLALTDRKEMANLL